MIYVKWLRVVFASLFLVAISAFFLDFNNCIPKEWNHLWHLFAHVQIVPAILGFGAAVLIVWLLTSVLFGRVYCSVICPFGIMQDVFARVSKLFRGKNGKYGFRPEMSKTRYTILGAFLTAIFVSPLVVTILDPYSNFGRVMVSVFRPILIQVNNILAGSVGKIGSVNILYHSNPYDFHAVVAAVIALIIVGGLSFFFGRRYCNTICPVGTLLGVLSTFSLFKIRMKSDCIGCGLCEKVCKGECIDGKNKFVDSSRCVACFNCLGACKRSSLVYAISTKPATQKSLDIPKNQSAMVPVKVSTAAEPDRRSFMQWSVFTVFIPSIFSSIGASRSAPAPEEGLPVGVSRVGYEKTAPIIPPGAKNLERFQRRCTGCHLCVAKCPAGIIRPSSTELGWSGFLQPVLKFDYDFCNYDCTICSQICPSHALLPLSVDEKHLLQIGKVVFLQENCVVETQQTNCGACAEHCPTGAVRMVEHGPPEMNLTIPVTDPELCVGCGACEKICPVRPYKAIYVDGMLEHAKAKLGYDPDEKQETIELDDFGF